jgi:hypothetical protein
VLNIQPAIATTLSNITIAAIRIHLLQFFPSSTSISFRQSTARTRPTSAEKSTITIEEVVRPIFLLLSGFYFNHSPLAYHYRQINFHNNGHGMPFYALVQANEGERRFHFNNRRLRTSSSDITRMVSARIDRLENDRITADFEKDDRRWDNRLTTVLDYLRESCMRYEEHKSPTTMKTEPQIEEVDIPSLDGGDNNVSEVNEDDEAGDFRIQEFRQVGWREALCYGTLEEKDALSKTVTLPPPSLQDVSRYECEGCTSAHVRGIVGTEKFRGQRRVGDVKCTATPRQPGEERKR